MKLMMFERGGKASLGAVDGDQVVDLATADAGLPADLAGLIAAGPDALARAKSAAQSGSSRYALSDVTAALPIARPEKMICVGLNYALHAREGGHDIPTYPVLLPARRQHVGRRRRACAPSEVFRAA